MLARYYISWDFVLTLMCRRIFCITCKQREDDESSCTTSASIVESTASLNNVLPYQEFGGGPEDLLVMVDKPEKILATMDTYVMFRVTTKVNN